MRRIVPDSSFWVPESKEKNRRCKRYGITPNIYNKMFDMQNGCCAICGTHQSEQVNKLCIDHNHITGMVRGLLCSKCNSAIAYMNEDIKLLKSAIKYLSDYTQKNQQELDFK